MFFICYNKSKQLNTNIFCENFTKSEILLDENNIVFQTKEIIIFSNNLFYKIYQSDNLFIIGQTEIINKDCFNKFESDFELIESLFLQYGPEFITKVNGDFSFIIWNKGENELLVYRDHIGNFPIYYSVIYNNIYISSQLSYICSQINKLNINLSWVNHMLNRSVSPLNQTIYKEIYRFIPAYYYIINSIDFISKRYWDLNIEMPKIKKEKYQAEFLSKLENAILKRTLPDKNGFELSGGLDSSTIACITLKKAESKVSSYTHTLPENAINKFKPFIDERNFIEDIKNLYPSLNENYIAEARNSIIKDFKNYILSTKDLPQQQLNILSSEIYLKVKQQNLRTLFSGFGGDELVSSTGKYFIIELIFKNRYLQLLKAIISWKRNKLSYIKMILLKIWRVKSYLLGINKNATHNIKQYLFLNKNCPKEFYAINQSFYKEPAKKNYYHSKLKESVTRNHITSRIENGNIAGYLNGFVYKHPLLDKELMEYYFSLPFECHNTFNWSRNLIRSVTKDIIPETLRLKRDKSIATVPNVIHRIYIDREEIRNYLKSYNRNSFISSVIDINKLTNHLELILKNAHKKGTKVNQRVLINYLTILIFFDLYENDKLLRFIS